MKNFWLELKKPFFALAPMDDVTDVVFREIVAQYAKPDVLFTEFVSCEGIVSTGFEKLITKFRFTPKQHPIVAQIWGINPENFYKTAQLLEKMGFDGIDINMGCPDKKVIKKGGGSGCINDPNLAQQVFQATRKGAKNIPVSIKTRVGFKKIQTEEWVGFLLGLKPDALTVHGRTMAEMSKVPAHWDEIAKAVNMRNKLKSKTLIIGNGDIKNYQEGLEKVDKYGVDGVMVGRGIFENLWIFDPKKEPEKVTIKQRLKALLEHTVLFEKTWGKEKNFAILRKFFKIYVRNFEGAVDLRMKLMEADNASEVKKLVAPFL